MAEEMEGTRLDKIKTPSIKCPLVGRIVLVEDEVFCGISCIHCEYYGGQTEDLVYCLMKEGEGDD